MARRDDVVEEEEVEALAIGLSQGRLEARIEVRPHCVRLRGPNLALLLLVGTVLVAAVAGVRGAGPGPLVLAAGVFVMALLCLPWIAHGLWLRRGVETVTIVDEAVILSRRAPLFDWWRSYPALEIDNLRRLEPEPLLPPFERSRMTDGSDFRLAFDYQGRHVAFAPFLSDEDAERLLRLMRQQGNFFGENDDARELAQRLAAERTGIGHRAVGWLVLAALLGGVGYQLWGRRDRLDVLARRALEAVSPPPRRAPRVDLMAYHRPHLDPPGLKLYGLEELEDVDLLPLQDPDFPRQDIGSLLLGRTGVTDAGLRTLVRLPIERLWLQETAVTDEGLRRLEPFLLEDLCLNETAVGDEGLAILAGQGHALVYLKLGSTRVTDEGLAHLAEQPLRYLQLRDTAVTDEGLAHLAGMPIVTLDLDHTAVSDDAVEHLRALPRLRTVLARGTELTEEGAARLAETHPEVRVVLSRSAAGDDEFGSLDEFEELPEYAW